MLRINKKLEYALIALRHMALKRPQQLTSAREISLRYQTPFDTTAKMMRLLSQAQLLRSSQGARGGYLLNCDLGEVGFVELAEIVERKNFDLSCEGPQGPCSLVEVCNIKSPLRAINNKLREFFSGISVQELLLLERDQCPSQHLEGA